MEKAYTLEGISTPIVIDRGTHLTRPEIFVAACVLLYKTVIKESGRVDELEDGVFALKPEVGILANEAAGFEVFEYLRKPTVVLKVCFTDKLVTGHSDTLIAEGLDDSDIRVRVLEE